MVFFIENRNFDTMKKRKVMAFIVVLLTAGWTPVARELFLGIMNTELIQGITIGLVVSITALFGAYSLWTRRWF